MSIFRPYYKIISTFSITLGFLSSVHAVENLLAPSSLPNQQPIASAGADQVVYSGQKVLLKGTASDADGDKLTYLWRNPKTNNPQVLLSNTDKLVASFTAPTTTSNLILDFAFVVTDPKGGKSKDKVAITVKPLPVVESTTNINDTGLTVCGDYARGHSGISNNDVVCGLHTDTQNDPVPNGQDGSSGRDINFPDNSDGLKGFSFTKLDSTGNSLVASAAQWVCIKDNVTGLTWENKTNDGGLHDKDDSFVWYESDPRLGYGGLPGYELATDYDATRSNQTCVGFTYGNSLTYCNTKAYVNRVNLEGYCGSKNWRLPTREELHSLVAYESSPRIDTNFFPQIQTNYYWTSVPYAYLNKHIWAINFQYGGGSPWEKHYNYPVMLVHN